MPDSPMGQFARWPPSGLSASAMDRGRPDQFPDREAGVHLRGLWQADRAHPRAGRLRREEAMMSLSGYWRWGGKDYGWFVGIPGVLIVEQWCPTGAKPDPALWGHADA